MKKLKLLSLFFIITLLGCTEENNYYTTAEGLGKTNVYIEGDLTDAEVAEKLANEVGSITENIYIGSEFDPLTNLTTIELDIPVTVRKIEFSTYHDQLKNVKIKGHGKMEILEINIRYNKTIENILIEGITELHLLRCINNNYVEKFLNIQIKDLKIVRKGISISTSDAYGGSFICNDLEYVDPNIVFDGSVSFNGNFNNISMSKLKKTQWLQVNAAGNIIFFPALEEVNVLLLGKYTANPSNSLTELNFPVLTKINSYLDCKADKLGTLNLPLLTYCNEIVLRDQVLPSTTINMPLLNYCTYYESNMQLNTSGVNAVLYKFLTIQPVTSKFIELSDEVAPSGQGILDKQTLINQGNLVYTN